MGLFADMAPPGIGSSTPVESQNGNCQKNLDIKILDGGFATQLSCHTNKPIDGDVLWSARFLSTDKEAVINAHLDFLRGKVTICSKKILFFVSFLSFIDIICVF